MRCTATGPTNARIVAVGEAPGAREEAEGLPFIGSAGDEFNDELSDAGLLRSEIFVTNVCMDRPADNKIDIWINPNKKQRPGEVKYRGKWVAPLVVEECERLYNEIRAVKPNVVVALGNTPMWALTDKKGVGKWRGSTLESDVISHPDTGRPIKVIPAYHPAAILRQMDWRFVTVQDFRRIKREAMFSEVRRQEHKFILNPDYNDVIGILRSIITRLDRGPCLLVCDLEIKRNEILCLGLGWSRNDAICIPFYNESGHRWTPEQHVQIVLLLQRLFLHHNCRLANQNISFDIQYLFWRFNVWPRAIFDTMLAQNVLFAGTPKKLDYLASLYCEHYIYWKDDGKFWDKPVIYPQLWHYNCLDCSYTYEIIEAQVKALNKTGLMPQMEFVMRMFQPVMQMMLRGVKVNDERKRPLLKELQQTIFALTQEAEYMAGVSLTGDKGSFSSHKLFDLFYERLKLPTQYNRKGGINIRTADDEGLKKLSRIEPIIRPLTERISMARSYKTAADAADAKLDRDGRWRTAYGVAVTNTYRFNSSENPFGSGLNLQNLTVGKDMTL